MAEGHGGEARSKVREGHGGDARSKVVTLPDWCKDSGKNLPLVYQHVLEAVSE
jgi:hypothetical protein